MSAQPGIAIPHVRAMRQADLDAIAAIESRSYDFPWGYGIFSDCLIASYYCIVVEVDGEITGYAIMSIAAAEAHILNLCVDVTWQRQGLGRLLLDEILNYARRQSVQRIFLEVRPSNAVAVRLYEEAGFNRLGVRPDYYQARSGREDALVFAIQLGDSL
jgi:ribosomal-protein-alanine N-acetyltransferase